MIATAAIAALHKATPFLRADAWEEHKEACARVADERAARCAELGFGTLAHQASDLAEAIRALANPQAQERKDE